MTGAVAAGRSFGAYRLVRPLEDERNAYLVVRGDSDERLVLHLLDAPPPSPVEARAELARYAALSHVAIHRLIDWFEVDGTLALVFEHFDGLTLSRLSDYLERDGERLADAAVWFLGWRLIGALGKAHLARDRSGALAPIVHGRVNPNELLVTWDGEARLTGLCPHLGDVDPVPARPWLAPELRRGDQPTAKSDSYSTAIILRWLLTGRPPPAPGGSVPPLRGLRPDIPVDVARALDRALHAEPGRRPSCPELAQRVEGLVNIGEGRARLRECMDLYRALWGLWSEPELYPPSAPVQPASAIRAKADEAYDPLDLDDSDPTADIEEPPPPTSRSAELQERQADPTATETTAPKTAVIGSGATTEIVADAKADATTAIMSATTEIVAEARALADATTAIMPASSETIVLEPPAPFVAEPPAAHVVQPRAPFGSDPMASLRPPPFAEDSAPPVLPGSRPRDEALAWRWVAFAALAVAAAAIAWHRVRAVEPATEPAAQSIDDKPAPVAVASPARHTAEPEEPVPPASSSDALRSPRWPPRRITTDGVEPGELLVDEGYLVVESRLQTRVYANGVDVGPTNRRNKARCRFKFVRLGRLPGEWISEGVTVDIVCGAITTVRLEPYPATPSSGKNGNDRRADY